VDPNTPIRLTAAQRRRMQELLRQPGDSPRVHLRITALLMSARGTGGEQIALTLGVTRRTITNIRARWNERGMSSLLDRPRTGRPAQAGATYRAALRRTVQRDPRKLGYAFARWTAPRLAAHLATQTGVSLSPPRVAALLRKEGFVWRRTKRTLRNLQDRTEVERARQRLLRVKRGPSRPELSSSCGSATG
jgi:transposase